MKAKRKTILRLINEHFQSVFGNQHVQEKVVTDKDRGRLIMQKKPGTYKRFD